jgi:hypothetical protein
MATFRITKYNPANRDEAGRYLKNEWTSISDIGCTLDGSTLTLKEYLSMEDDYVAIVKNILVCMNFDALQVVELETNSSIDYLPEELVASSRESCKNIQDGCHLQGSSIDDAVRLALREVIWCKLTGEGGFYIHFGWDYYMYVGLTGDLPSSLNVPKSIFMETFRSPYLSRSE